MCSTFSEPQPLCSATWPRRCTCRWIKQQPSYPASIPRCRGSFGLAGYHQFVLNFADLTKRVAQIWSSGRSSAGQRLCRQRRPSVGKPCFPPIHSADGHLEQSLGAILSQQVGWTTLSFTSAGACQSGCSTVELEVTPPLLPPRLPIQQGMKPLFSCVFNSVGDFQMIITRDVNHEACRSESGQQRLQ